MHSFRNQVDVECNTLFRINGSTQQQAQQLQLNIVIRMGCRLDQDGSILIDAPTSGNIALWPRWDQASTWRVEGNNSKAGHKMDQTWNSCGLTYYQTRLHKLQQSVWIFSQLHLCCLGFYPDAIVTPVFCGHKTKNYGLGVCPSVTAFRYQCYDKQNETIGL